MRNDYTNIKPKTKNVEYRLIYKVKFKGLQVEFEGCDDETYSRTKVEFTRNSSI